MQFRGRTVYFGDGCGDTFGPSQLDQMRLDGSFRPDDSRTCSLTCEVTGDRRSTAACACPYNVILPQWYNCTAMYSCGAVKNMTSADYLLTFVAGMLFAESQYQPQHEWFGGAEQWGRQGSERCNRPDGRSLGAG